MCFILEMVSFKEKNKFEPQVICTNRNFHRQLVTLCIMFICCICILYSAATMFEFNFNNSIFSRQWNSFQEYSQKYLSLQEILGKDEYLNKLNDENKIIHFKNGSLRILSNPSVGCYLSARKLTHSIVIIF